MSKVNQPDRIFMVGVNGKGLHQVVPGGCPAQCGDAVEGNAFSPDGKRLVFTRAVGPKGSTKPAYVELWTAQQQGVDLYLINSDGTGLHLLSHTDLNESGAYWGRL